MTNLPSRGSQRSDLDDLLAEAEALTRSGDRRGAHTLCLQAAEANPRDANAWLMCARTAASIQEAANYLSRASAVQAFDPAVKRSIFRFVRQLISQDPYIVYIDEDQSLYHIRCGGETSLLVPKDRAIPEPYPANRPVWLHKAYQWLWIGFLGLPFAGLGAIISAPLAATAAFRLYQDNPIRSNRVHSLVILMLAGFLWLVGLLLAVILVMHIV